MERLEALYELATSYHSCRDTEGLLKAFARDLRARLGPQAVLLWLKDGGENGLHCREKSFAAGVDRASVEAAVADFSRACFAGKLELWEHVGNVLAAMQAVAGDLDLDGALVRPARP